MLFKVIFSIFSQPENESIYLINHLGYESGYPPPPKKAVIYSPLHRQYARVHRELLMDGWLVRRECNCQMLMRLQKKRARGRGEAPEGGGTAAPL